MIENYEEDVRYILAKNNLTLSDPSKVEMNKSPSKGDKVMAYMEKISKGDRMELYEKFRVDFEMFGYSPHPYL